MKKNALLVIFFILGFSLFAQNVKIGVLSGSSAIPSAFLMNTKPELYDFEVFSKPSDLISQMISKELDAGFISVNAAAKVYKASNGLIVCCKVTGNSSLSLITKDKSIKKFSDLAGKKVYVSEKGSFSEYLVKYLAAQNGVEVNTSGGIQLDFSVPASLLVSYLINDRIQYAVVSEPLVSLAKSKNHQVFTALNLQSEYEALEGEGKNCPVTVMVVRKEFAVNNPEVLNKFLQDYEESVEWTINHPSSAGKLCKKFNLGIEEAMARDSIPESNYVFINANDDRKEIENVLNIFGEYGDSSQESFLPDQNFYYHR